MKRGWSRNSAMVGALAWTAMCAYSGSGNAPLGVVELLLLFAALVVVPSGLALGDGIAPAGSGRSMHALEIFQPFAAMSLAGSFWISPGAFSAALALPWAGLCVAIALLGVWSLRRARSMAALAVNFGRMDLAIAAAWLLESRFGLRPMGFHGPAVLLTAVHFHYTGFAGATILAALLRAGTGSRVAPGLRRFAFLVLFVPFVLAAEFYSPFLKMAAGLAMVVCLWGLAVIQLVLARRVASRASRAYLFTSSFSLAAGMGIAGINAVRDWLHRDWLVVSQVAHTHGVLNALGFSLCGILGWLIEFAPTSPQSIYFTADEQAVAGTK